MHTREFGTMSQEVVIIIVCTIKLRAMKMWQEIDNSVKNTIAWLCDKNCTWRIGFNKKKRCWNHAFKLWAYKFHDEIPLTYPKCTLGFHLHRSWKLRRWKWWYGSAYCTHNTPISSLRRPAEKIAHIRHKIKLQNLSFVFSDS